ncbi:Ectopic P granules protein 5 [Phytophthora cinnamomi]|uniref:Ectopic P granules protein 5 n=1 Tax=Phytophthora cinnamomi TaxID=4785 RepID=UPI003559771E|nr:Ectopic P granules protein 5 [Phytophthora cinnamomi]
MKFSENLSVLVALDSEMVDSVSQLYISKARTVTQNLPCPEGPSCRSPAAFRFEFLEWMMDSRMDDAIESIRAQGERCDMRSMLIKNVMSSLSEHDDGSTTDSSPTLLGAEQFLRLDGDGFMLSLQILLIDQVVRTLGLEHERLQRLKKTLEDEPPMETPADDNEVLQKEENVKNVDVDFTEAETLTPIQKTEQEVECLHNKGLEWFRLLTELDTKLSRMVPPLREALWRSIKKLGLSFVCVDERETCTLLQLMLEDPSRITLLSDCFFPAAAPSRFVEMFAKLMSASSSAKLSSEEKLTLLRRFDFRAWLQTKSPQTPTKFDRDTVLCMILGDISHQFPADRSLVDTGRKTQDKNASQHLDEVLRVYAKVLQLICSAHLEDHVEKMVAEKSIEKWIIEERRGMWGALALRLQVPELSGDEFETACLEQGKLLTLQVLFLQQLRRAPVLTESLSLALLTKLMGWMERARVGSGSLAQMKLLFLAAEVTNFVCKPLAEVLPSTLKKQMLRQMCDLLLELGHARRNNGIMKAIGLGGSLQYGVEFHVSCLAAGIYLRLQTRNGAPLRVDDRIPFKMTRTTEKHLRSLETMLQSKDAFQLGRRADALVDFARDPRRSLADQDEFFVTLFSSMYPAQGWLLAKCLP